MEDLKKKLSELCTTPGVPSTEGMIRKILKKYMKNYVDQVEVDDLGNLITKKGKGGTKVMLAAHMDEIGLIVKHINDEGFIKFSTLGGFDDRTLLTQRVKIFGSKGPVYGAIGAKPPHLQEKKEKEKAIKIKKLFIDVGAKDKEEANKLGIQVGDPILLDRSLETLGPKNRVTAKALDDRVGCLCMIEAVRKLKAEDFILYAVGTIQEEVGLKGARVSAFKITPDVGLAIDTTIAGDTPEIEKHEAAVGLGKGPVICLKDKYSIIHPKVKQILVKTAKKNKIPYQTEVLDAGGTDAAVIQLTKTGIPAGTLAVPTRYIHSAVGVLDLKDVQNTIKLLVKTIPRLAKEFKT